MKRIEIHKLAIGMDIWLKPNGKHYRITWITITHQAAVLVDDAGKETEVSMYKVAYYKPSEQAGHIRI